jgi:hypothetical protein
MTYGSIAPSTRKSYNSTWRKWTVFMQTCHHNPSEDQINCKDITQPKLLELLMFVAYCINVLKIAPTSIPGILVLYIIQQNTQQHSSKNVSC